MSASNISERGKWSVDQRRNMDSADKVAMRGAGSTKRPLVNFISDVLWLIMFDKIETLLILTWVSILSRLDQNINGKSIRVALDLLFVPSLIFYLLLITSDLCHLYHYGLLLVIKSSLHSWFAYPQLHSHRSLMILHLLMSKWKGNSFPVQYLIPTPRRCSVLGGAILRQRLTLVSGSIVLAIFFSVVKAEIFTDFDFLSL